MARFRYAHSVRPVKDDRQPARFIALEIETKVVSNEQEKRKRSRTLARWTYQAWTCETGRAGKVTSKTGRSLSVLWAALGAPLSFPGITWIICRGAVGVCSLLGIWDRLTEGTLAWPTDGDGMVCLEDPPTVIDVRIPGRAGTLRIVDVRNWGMLECRTAAEIGNAVRSMVDTLVSRGLGSLQVTAGSQAWFSYRRKYVRHNLYVHCRLPVLSLERRSLAGGRCEVYLLGRVAGPIHQLDFSSFYGSILQSSPLPVRLRYSGPGESDLLREELDARRGMVAECCITTNWPHLPHSRDGIVIYPTGRFWSVLAGPDLYSAHDAGEIVGFGKWASYDMEPAFERIAGEIIAIRHRASTAQNRPLREWAKALAVTLVGRFAQQGKHWETVRHLPSAEVCRCPTGASQPGPRCHRCGLERPWAIFTAHGLDGVTSPRRRLAGREERQVDHGETRESMPALASYVYAYGRRKLWEAQLAAGREEVYYCVTDSLFVSDVGYQRLKSYSMVSDGEPGKLRLVAVHDWIELFGLNHYRVPGRHVCAGSLPQGSDVGTAGMIGWRQRTAREEIALGRPPTADEVLCMVERASPYRHGVRGPEGRITPWNIG